MSNDNTMENFWGCTLIKGKTEYSWNPIETEEDVEHKLQLTSACLGPKAKSGERNLVEVTTEDDSGKQTTCSIISLRAGQNECLHLELGFNNPTKFTLREGHGPISLCGVHLQAGPIDFSDDDSDTSGDEDIPNLVEPIEAKKLKEQKSTAKKPGKRPLEEDNKQDKQAPKKKKLQPELESEEDDDEDDEEEDEEESGEEGSEDEEMPSLLDGEAVEDDDEESEDEDEPEGDSVDDEDEEEDDDDDEEEEDSDEEEEQKPQKKKLTNGHTPKSKQADKKEQSKKTPAKTPNTKTPQKTPAKKSTEEIKTLLLKSPNIPKKMDKFENYMKNNMKVTDKKTLNEIWEYVQKNRK